MEGMGSYQKLERYLNAEMEKLRSAAPAGPESGSPRPFVTISRQAGAGAILLADTMLEVFGAHADAGVFSGWQVFDHNLTEIIRAEPSIAESLDSLLAEEYRSPTTDFFHQLVRSTSDQDRVMARVFQAVRSLATIGKTIIIGRAGSQVTADLPLGFHLRVVSPESDRVAQLMESDDLTERKARSELRKLDGRRERLLRVHFEVDIGDPMGYDAVWNLGSSTYAEIASATAAAISRRVLDRAGS